MHLGEPVEVHVLAYPSRIFKAKLAYVAPAVDPNTHRLPVRAEVENPDGALKPEMFASFSIITGDAHSAPGGAGRRGRLRGRHGPRLGRARRQDAGAARRSAWAGSAAAWSRCSRDCSRREDRDLAARCSSTAPPRAIESSEPADIMNGIVTFALRQRILMVVLLVLLFGAGIMTFLKLNIEAYPDPVPPLVDIVTQSTGQSAEEIERYVTIPIEIQMAGIPHITAVRTISLFGLSATSRCSSPTTSPMSRREQWVINRLSQLSPLPNGAQPQISPAQPDRRDLPLPRGRVRPAIR